MQEEIASSPLASSLNGKPVSELTAEEKAFYFFKLHDLDKDDSLDGLELLQAAMHHHHGEPATYASDTTDVRMPPSNDVHDHPSAAIDKLNELQSKALDENDEDSLDHITGESSHIKTLGNCNQSSTLSYADVIDEFIAHADIDHNGLLSFAEYTKATIRPHIDASSADIDSDQSDK